MLHTGAYWLMLKLRDAIPRPQPLASAEFTTLRARLLKIADLRAMQRALTALIAQCNTRGDADDQLGCPLIETLLGSATNGR